jgi:hypothetical protein
MCWREALNELDCLSPAHQVTHTSKPRRGRDRPCGRPRTDPSVRDYRAGLLLLPVTEDERGGVVAGERVHHVNGPARRSRAGLVFRVSP